MQIKLAEALLRRKELNDKVAQLKTINVERLFETKAVRRKVTDDIDDIVAKIPKLKMAQVAAGYDYYSKQLRLVDAAIQQANWATDINVPENILTDYTEPETKE